jgi:hypothetical protein
MTVIYKENDMGTKLINIKKLMAEEHMQNKIRLAMESKDKSFASFHDYPVRAELKNFAEAVEKAMPNVKFYPRDIDRIVAPDHQYWQVTEFAVYMDDYPFAFGQINFGNNAVKGDGDTYGVYSRKIQNAKYGTHRDQYHMQMTVDLKKAVKLALTYLVPFTHKELAKAHYEDLHVHVARHKEKADNLLGSVASPIRGNNMALLAEIQHLMKQGIEFKTPEFKEVAGKIDEVVDNYHKELARKISAQFVRFRQVGEDTYADVQEVQGVRDTRWVERAHFTSDVPTTYHINELPADISGQVSVLNILADEQYVPYVGQKIDDKTFWIERG